jgi:hypothetical protein
MDNQPTQLSITDLAVIKNVIDLASTRGAFRAAEMKAVGEVYDKLTVFLETVIKQAEAEVKPDQQGESK